MGRASRSLRAGWSERIVAAVAALSLILGATACSGPEPGAPGEAGGAGGDAVFRGEGSGGSSREPGVPAAVAASGFGFGEPVSPAEVAAWDIDVGPDGEGLPPGSGTVDEGAVVWEASCARCHGPQGVDGSYGPVVATEGSASFPFATDPALTTSIGNYWPYATTVFDYVRRSMPFDDPGSLSDDEVYAVTAWLLWRNERIPEDAVMDAQTLPRVQMPAREHFVPSDDVAMDGLP